jgi:hypothetical protein
VSQSYTVSLENPNIDTKRWVLVAHVCNPSYSGGRDQSKPRKIVHKTLFQKNASQKKGLMEWLKVKA